MSLSHLIKHIYNNASDEVFRRGKKIHLSGHIDIIDHNPLLNHIVFRVKDDMYQSWYKVRIDNYTDPKGMTLNCTCPYNLTEVCRHKAAALLQLQTLADRGILDNKEIRHNQKHTQAKMKVIDLKMIRTLAGNENYEAAEEWLRINTPVILNAANETVDAELVINNETFKIRLHKNDERFFDTSCNCVDEEHTLCCHKTIVFFHLLNNYGANYFESIRNFDRDKEKLLSLYGYSLQDDLTGKFEFVYKDNKPFLRVLDPTIKRVASPTQTPHAAPVAAVVTPAAVNFVPEVSKKLGIVFKEQPENYPWFSVEAIQGDPLEGGGIIGTTEWLDLSKYINTEVFDEEDKHLVQQIRKLSDAEVNKFLNRNSPFSGIWENIVHTNGSDLPEETRLLIHEYLHPKLQRIFADHSARQANYILRAGKKFLTSNLEPVELVTEPIELRLEVNPAGDQIEIKSYAIIQGVKTYLQEQEWAGILLYLKDGKLYGWQKPEDVLLADSYRHGKLIDAAHWPSFAEKTLMPLTRDYQVYFHARLTQEVQNETPDVVVQLIEKGDFLVFNPIFSYNDIPAPADEQPTITMVKNGQIMVVHRMLDKERNFLQKLEALHTNFIRPERSRQLVLKGTEVLKNNWFFLFVETMKDMNIPLLGFDQLRNFRFNTLKPSTQVRISSGVDWFDAKVAVSFGDQQVRIADIKQALSNKQSVVPLQDGSLGILPEDWLKKYSLLFRVGEGKGDLLRLSRYQFGVIDELYDQRDDEELQIELEERFDKLRSFKRIKKLPPPTHLKNILRPYQVTGFHWLNFLQETGCGGILADDMGLGKTVQALSMLEHFENKTGKLKALVVCPTTLLYNWENEIKKFTPDLEYFIHHGGQRTRLVEDLEPHHIIITTYGTLRSDILLLQKIQFDYVILDESQAIKNPNSKVAKAACLINSTHRVCMSGTPLQNNTFDIYAQMNFLNPGLLGSTDFFRNEFATPIDKFGEEEQKLHLRKLLYPFILRRTKEQVAKDLPEKTETILYCEMESEQRRIYDAFRNDFRDKVLGAIDSVGIGRSQLTILQGLMKLRQICDSPAILNEPEKYPNHSIKLEELAREITENISDHKALVFSQFLGMLSLIKHKLQHLGVQFEYFDGSTTVTDRQKAIDNFQSNPECRVFLISLKAGGVGLNLTAADYVYIVDPWWNPAVEQQAIDRTHRIGQTRNIFAYRMICKDTVEDKIIQLQEKKRLLAKELISDDAGFVKKLTRDDIEYLFS
ncbi:MAG: SNF2 family helicase [Chitinophagaceae bacterium]|nr:SNF2 family helicase [Chitinophagaceae bacterium]